MTKNYGELLPKTIRLKTLMLSRGSRGYRAAETFGLIQLMRSTSLHAFAQAAVGRALERMPGIQVICYGAGDYSGPHNDHHPEDDGLRDGYVDLHINLPNDAVAHQWLVYELEGYLSAIESLTIEGSVSVFKLPFWHYTTPLVSKRGRETEARRWLLLASFTYA